MRPQLRVPYPEKMQRTVNGDFMVHPRCRRYGVAYAIQAEKVPRISSSFPVKS